MGGARKEVRGQLVNLKLDLRSYYQVSVSGQLDNGDTLTGPGSVCTLTGMYIIIYVCALQCIY